MRDGWTWKVGADAFSLELGLAHTVGYRRSLGCLPHAASGERYRSCDT